MKSLVTVSASFTLTVYRLYTDCIALIYDPLPSGLASPLT